MSKNLICIKCALETNSFTREPHTFYEERKRPKQNDKEVIRDLEDL